MTDCVFLLKRIFFSLGLRFRSIFSAFLSFLFSPEHCVRCGSLCYGMPMCRKCRTTFLHEISFPAENFCAKCGKPLLSSLELCFDCRDEPIILHADKVAPLYSYRIWRKNLLFLWKFSGYRNFASFFAEALERKISRLQREYGVKKICIVPVPPRPGKLRRNGWDQINDLCNVLEFVYGYRQFHLLKRVSAEQQKKKNRLTRIESKNSIYVLNAKAVMKCRSLPEDVFLVDDIITTGVTVESCSEILKSVGVKRVFVLSVLIVD